ncbi:MAG: hypothetical protein L0K86_29645, partial [Actinomycetia bacterium]|nr:hypothetical protein [Actinomycetes bacterium]
MAAIAAVRWSATLGAWARREAVLASALGVGVALAALSQPLNQPWMVSAGAGVAVTGAVVSLGIRVFRGRLEGQRERTESLRRLRAPVAAVSDVDPIAIGVDPAAQDLLTGDRLPRYLPREVDAHVRAAITAAVEGRADFLVVVAGASKIGKSRSLFEALRACEQGCPAARDMHVVAPVDGDGLRALLVPGQGPRLRRKPAVLWLDDLEPFLNQAVTWQNLREWQADGRGRIVVATYGGKGSDLVAEGGAGERLTTLAEQVLQHAQQIPMTATSDAELTALDRAGSTRRQVSVDERAVVARFGLAAYLVAGPALERKLTTGRHAAGWPSCPEGVAVVRAAVDWARCGRTDPITDEMLREVWPAYLPRGTASSDDGFTRGLEWALRPVAGAVALVYRTGSYAAYDYVVRLTRNRPDGLDPLDVTWAAAIRTAGSDQAPGVALAAYREARLVDAAAAFRVAGESTDSETAAISGYNLGVVLGELDRAEDAVVAYRQVIDRY